MKIEAKQCARGPFEGVYRGYIGIMKNNMETSCSKTQPTMFL